MLGLCAQAEAFDVTFDAPCVLHFGFYSLFINTDLTFTSLFLMNQK